MAQPYICFVICGYKFLFLLGKIRIVGCRTIIDQFFICSGRRLTKPKG